MQALFLNGTLKPSPDESNTGALARYVGGVLERDHGVAVEHVRLVDEHVAPGVVSEAVHDGDGWPAIHAKVLAAEILVLCTPTWLGQVSSVTKAAMERMDALLSEATDDGTPIAYNKVAGFIVTGNEDGAHACIANMAQGLIDVGFTVPGQAWTYWNKGPGPGEEVYSTSDETDWTHSTGDAMAHVLAHTARALAASPIPKPPNA